MFRAIALPADQESAIRRACVALHVEDSFYLIPVLPPAFAGMHVSMPEAERINRAITRHCEDKSKEAATQGRNSNNMSTAPQMPGIVHKVEVLRLQIAEKKRALSKKNLSKSGRKNMNKRLSKMRRQLESYFKVGVNVAMKCLKRCKNLNGTTGTIVEERNDKDQVRVHCFLDGKNRLIKLCNLCICEMDEQRSKSSPDPMVADTSCFEEIQRIVTGYVMMQQNASTPALKCDIDKAIESFRLKFSNKLKMDPIANLFNAWMWDSTSACAHLVDITFGYVSKSKSSTSDMRSAKT